MQVKDRQKDTPEHRARAGALAVERAIMELRRGRAIKVGGAGESLASGSIVIHLLENLDQFALGEAVQADGFLHLLITAERAAALGVPVNTEAAAVRLPATSSLASLLELSGIGPEQVSPGISLDIREITSPVAEAALYLARQAEMLPALLFCPTLQTSSDPLRLTLELADIHAHPARRGQFLRRVSAAPVQLQSYEQCEFVVFREQYSDVEHVAIVVGNPDTDQPVLVRLHSSCLTGDLFGSLRCDCGEQLKNAVTRMAENGGGVVLYLNQEGRGIGLANKLRAYRLQDAGFDTIEANQQLGFDADERAYTAAASMLQDLGIQRLQLLTNNPTKIKALAREGIEVVGRMASKATINPYNARYLKTKQGKGGHLSTGVEGVQAL